MVPPDHPIYDGLQDGAGCIEVAEHMSDQRELTDGHHVPRHFLDGYGVLFGVLLFVPVAVWHGLRWCAGKLKVKVWR